MTRSSHIPEKKTQSVVRQAGFTLVETLVAISILSLSILGTFTAVQNGLQSSTFAKDQITAFYLAQESMEYIRNIRDENAIVTLQALSTGSSGRNWLAGLSDVPSDPCYFGKTCTIDSPMKQVTACFGSWGSCPYLNQDTTTSLFGYSSGWPQSKFKREIQFTQISAHEVNVTVSISWTSGGFAKTLRVQQLLLDWQ